VRDWKGSRSLTSGLFLRVLGPRSMGTQLPGREGGGGQGEGVSLASLLWSAPNYGENVSLGNEPTAFGKEDKKTGVRAPSSSQVVHARKKRAPICRGRENSPPSLREMKTMFHQRRHSQKKEEKSKTVPCPTEKCETDLQQQEERGLSSLERSLRKWYISVRIQEKSTE